MTYEYCVHRQAKKITFAIDLTASGVAASDTPPLIGEHKVFGLSVEDAVEARAVADAGSGVGHRPGQLVYKL